jgi:hypothetical protein
LAAWPYLFVLQSLTATCGRIVLPDSQDHKHVICLLLGQLAADFAGRRFAPVASRICIKKFARTFTSGGKMEKIQGSFFVPLTFFCQSLISLSQGRIFYPTASG